MEKKNHPLRAGASFLSMVGLVGLVLDEILWVEHCGMVGTNCSVRPRPFLRTAWALGIGDPRPAGYNLPSGVDSSFCNEEKMLDCHSQPFPSLALLGL